MKVEEVMRLLEKMGDPSTKKTHARHGAKEPFFGVKVGELKKLVRQIKKNYSLALELFNTGNSDAMYLAGLIADEKQMTKADLENWAKKANWQYLSEYAVAWVAAESKYGYELAKKWIDSSAANVQTTGWSTLSSLAMITPDENLDLPGFKKLLDRVPKEISQAPNRVKYTMNGFVIVSGQCIEPLSEHALAIAKKIGHVEVDVGDTDCKVPHALSTIEKMRAAGKIGRKKKQARC